jgi:group I intron endonuclease
VFEVYVFTSPSGKRYVGFTGRPRARWLQHVAAARSGSQLPFHRAIRQYGAGAMRRELLERMSTEAGAKRAEQLWIRELGTLAPHGYNLTLGGEGTLGFRPGPEVRAKMSASHLGRPIDPATVSKSAASRRGAKRSAETRAKLSAARRARAAPSAETRAKTSAASRAAWARRKAGG